MIYIFDLDHTVIDSSHRQLTRADGSLDLDHWIENCTREKIYQDKLLPLARLMRSAYSQGHQVIVCTARVLSVWDHAFWLITTYALTLFCRARWVALMLMTF